MFIDVIGQKMILLPVICILLVRDFESQIEKNHPSGLRWATRVGKNLLGITYRNADIKILISFNSF